jgi:hypothetical protein
VHQRGSELHDLHRRLAAMLPPFPARHSPNSFR